MSDHDYRDIREVSGDDTERRVRHAAALYLWDDRERLPAGTREWIETGDGGTRNEEALAALLTAHREEARQAALEDAAAICREEIAKPYRMSSAKAPDRIILERIEALEAAHSGGERAGQ